MGDGDWGRAEGDCLYSHMATIDTIHTMKKRTRFIQLFYQIWIVLAVFLIPLTSRATTLSQESTDTFWFSLYRASNIEVLYFGIPNDMYRSFPRGIYRVKTGIPNQRPTPLPQVTGRAYWKITSQYKTDNPETAPYFLELDVPVSDGPPYGPVRYPECGGACNWVLPGAFGLHGVGGDESKLDATNAGSSGCIRHTDRDITALYTLLHTYTGELRYYIADR